METKTEVLPSMNPPSGWAIEQNLHDQRKAWLDSRGKYSHLAEVAMANIDMLLDYYPLGKPRDNTVEFHVVE